MQPDLWDNRARPAFHDKAYRRAAVAAWDERWHALSLAARRAFLHEVELPYERDVAPLPALRERFPAAALQELVAAGFVSVRESGRRPCVVRAPEAVDFAIRLLLVLDHRLLSDNEADRLQYYVHRAFATYDLGQAIQRVLEGAGAAARLDLFGNLLPLYLARGRWPDMVARYLGGTLTGKVLEVVEAAGGALPLHELPARLPGHDPAAVRAALDQLVTHLALFEGLEPDTFELLVGLLPSVRADRERARNTPPRPELQIALAPTDPGPEGGTVVPDLRAVLFELAAGRARLRTNGSLFHKEEERFERLLAPLPAWWQGLFAGPPDGRLADVLRWARLFQFVHDRREGQGRWVELTPEGRGWLGLEAEEQYEAVYEVLRGPLAPTADLLFLASELTAVREQAPTHELYRASVLAPEQRQPLRDALLACLRELPPGAFVPLAGFVARATHGPHNPVLLGLTPEQATVRVGGRLLPPLEDHLEDAGRQLLRFFFEYRLVPFGAVRVAPTEKPGRSLIARQPRLDALFGQSAPKATRRAADVARVVVQPDFSVIVIGLNPAPLAELAPFCERAAGSVGEGAMTYKLTRASVVRAVADGLPPEEIVARLERHASGRLPANVAREVRGWCDWIRPISASPAVLLRCPDRAAADRVQSALGRRAERLGDTIVVFPEAQLGSAEKQKLLAQGLLLPRESGEGPKRKKRRK